MSGQFNSPEELEAQQILASRTALGLSTAKQASEAPGNTKGADERPDRAGGAVHMRRVWAMPNRDTFSIPVIGDWVKLYLSRSAVSIDPFARNKLWATYTNDLNPETAAREHMDAEDFLVKYKNICPDLVIFDPPYSPGQIVEVYSKVGERRDGSGGRNGELYARVRNRIAEMSVSGTIVLSFGWNSSGMGKKHGFEQIELMLVCHGGAHNDTICLAERKL